MAWLDTAIDACKFVEKEQKSQEKHWGVLKDDAGEITGYTGTVITTTEIVEVWRGLSKTGADATLLQVLESSDVKEGTAYIQLADDTGQYHVHATRVSRSSTTTTKQALDPWDVPYLAQ